ncbi:hypothetical protein DNTS_035737 [Danionella cerebrum]|uniref:Beta-galactoside alpha-2,6-sialyltransferase 2 n=1 Tax=Danionella cerebrum TaxID=2873325 RepID=A0A553P0N6_9TELE|nr:hypothetical protein DNTS_035737 [Danionella translucida]
MEQTTNSGSGLSGETSPMRNRKQTCEETSFLFRRPHCRVFSNYCSAQHGLLESGEEWFAAEKMKSSLKQWRRLGLGLMVAWVLLFLALLSYFLDSRVDDPHAGAVLSYTDTRRLTSLQGNPRTIMGTHLGLPPSFTPSASSNPQLEQSQEENPSTDPQPSPLSQEAYPYPDPQSLAAWSAFGTQDVSSRSASMSRNRGRHEYNPDSLQQDDGNNNDDEEEEVAGGEEEEEGADEDRKRTTKQAVKHMNSDQEEYFIPRSKSVVHGLWKGSVSVGMLTPRLQRAMKDYLNNNKHGVSYRGRRSAKKSHSQVLCELKQSLTIQTLNGIETPFSNLGWKKIVPPLALNQLYARGFQTCAVVSSAGAMLHSALGQEIALSLQRLLRAEKLVFLEKPQKKSPPSPRLGPTLFHCVSYGFRFHGDASFSEWDLIVLTNCRESPLCWPLLSYTACFYQMLCQNTSSSPV